MSSQKTAEIAAPPERVWELLVDPAQRLRWVDELVATVPDRPPTGVGDEFVLKIREGGDVVDYRGEVTAFEPLRRYGVRMRRGPLEIGLDHRLGARHAARTAAGGRRAGLLSGPAAGGPGCTFMQVCCSF